LVILDEIGRGTATFDGLSIAWAVIEHLHTVNKCRALFATHYHELVALAARLDGLTNHTVRVKEWNDEVVFLHEVAPGAAQASYGIQVAKLAGLPGEVITRAEQVLGELERDDQAGPLTKLADDLPLFTIDPPIPPMTAAPSPALEALRDIHPDELSPKEALELMYKLRGLLD
jgi:DNA mismatch repair protein MutS